MKSACVWLVSIAFIAMFFSTVPVKADATSDEIAKAQATLNKAFDFLKAQQKPDFTWQAEGMPGIDAIVLKAFMSDEKFDADQPFLDKAFDKLLANQQANGGIYKDLLATYNTAIAVSALAVSKEAEYRAAVDKAVAYLRTQQWTDKIQGVPDDIKPKDDKNPYWGGIGYGGKKSRPDESNTQFVLDALHDAGVPQDDPVWKEALKFVSRCQNKSETNDQPWAGDDGGFIYTCADGGISNAGEYLGPGGKRLLRSYGSMTYAGLKSMIYAGLKHDDPRVVAAWKWISANFTVDENPGMSATGPENAKGGIYYYYYTMGRALAAYGEPVIVDPQGVKHDWRVALIDAIVKQQKDDGSFVGQRKWMEDSPVLVTAYTVQALEEAKKDLKAHPILPE